MSSIFPKLLLVVISLNLNIIQNIQNYATFYSGWRARIPLLYFIPICWT